MNLDKVLKIVWLINGLVIIVFLFIGLIIAVSELDLGSSRPYSSPEAEEAYGVLLSYETPIPIYNTDFSLMGVGFTKHNLESDKGASIDYYYFNSEDKEYHNCVNIIFLNKDYKPVKTLLNDNAFIESFQFPTETQYEKPDSTIKHITYLIAFKDSYADGDLNASDETDLYISDLNGSNLTQVTKDRKIIKHHFVDKGRKIFIEFMNRDKQADYDRPLFALYHIDEKRLEELTDIMESLNAVEKIIKQ
jgi:hypothetical protein